jgi:formylglycine-generating enzyme required for sulfatase activity
VNTLTAYLLVSLLAAKDPVKPGAAPDWLDTVPPIVTVQPVRRYQNNVFLAVFTANKRSRILISRNFSGIGPYEEYKAPIPISDEGETKMYYYAEDDFGNKSKLDSVEYIMDRRPPSLAVSPPSGHYRSRTVVRLKANKPCQFYMRSNASKGDSVGWRVPDTIPVYSRLDGIVMAVDSAGNVSNSVNLSYQIDSGTIAIDIAPHSGVFNRVKEITFTSSQPCTLYYTFDPLAPPEYFQRYSGSVKTPYGLTVVRYFARDRYGWQTEMGQATYVVDTIPPRIRGVIDSGALADTIALVTREPSRIFYTMDKHYPNRQSAVYDKPIVIPRKGLGMVKAVAYDTAGNESELYEWQRKYDFAPPVMVLSSRGGTFSRPCTLTVRTNEPARILYTLDGSDPSDNSQVYADGIVVSREGTTTVRCVAMDDAGNISAEQQAVFVLSTKPPSVKVRIDGSVDKNEFNVALTTDRDAQIYYETDGRDPTPSSPVYKDKIRMKLGDVLKYVAVGKAGNRTPIVTVDELRRPMVEGSPPGGIYNHRLKMNFVTSVPSRVFWHILPDTQFVPFSDSLVLKKEGQFTLEYYSETEAGIRSPVRRQTYTIDISAPRIDVSVRKGTGDSAIVLFQANENASIYYTIDGSNPAFSPTAKMVGNKYTASAARIALQRAKDMKLAFYAEDLAGNQSPISILDVFKPRAVPNVPPGRDRVYDRVPSISSSPLDHSRVFFARHGHVPTIDSAVFRDPITLLRSDTIRCFVVDASGFMGEMDTFVYLIDLPPSPQFVTVPPADSLLAGKPVRFDATSTIDNESPVSALWFRWDFQGDSVFDTPPSNDPVATFAYATPGLYHPVLEVTDAMKRVATVSKTVRVRYLCPTGMVYVVDVNGRTFCVDRYEWPNAAGATPMVSVSWVEAKMACRDAGKRLCTIEEWVNACRGESRVSYPYGTDYDQKRCPTEGEHPYPSGSFKNCGEGYGLRDMVGNTWEWVNDKDGDYPFMVGGSYLSGKHAHCGLVSKGTVATRTENTGFRCCK